MHLQHNSSVQVYHGRPDYVRTARNVREMYTCEQGVWVGEGAQLQLFERRGSASNKLVLVSL